ncbi:hypothetical protein [Serratia liquefaciens]|uniref:hypothetical protein n=1 Tax=Serratia liquefaciens TaxID=614 RepID=UPI0015A29533|nr:hypothetical protein [Serratia liquefaciens]NWA20350.1 hypothetical protein [Serratia liquefaciens]
MRHFSRTPKAIFLNISLSFFLSGCSAELSAENHLISPSKENGAPCTINAPESIGGCSITFSKIYGPFLPAITEKTLKKDVYADSNHVVTETKIYNKIDIPPKDDVIDWSIWISLLAFITSVVLPLYIRHKDKKKSINDDYWMRSVILPRINEILFSLTSSLTNAFQNHDGDETGFQSYFSGQYLSELGALRDSFSMIPSVVNKENIAEELETLCDNLDQKISDHLLEPIHVRKQDAQWFMQEVIKKIVVCQNMT